MQLIAQLFDTEVKYVYLVLFLTGFIFTICLCIYYWLVLDAEHDYGTKSLDDKTRNKWIYEDGKWYNYDKISK